jgi:next-to-BRCA1 protein 1
MSASTDKSFFTKFSPFETQSNSVPSVSKPMARFVRDVTLTDGSSVFPGTSVNKIWRVRNDGDRVWPEGITLTFSSGDLLAGSPDDLIVPVQSLNPGEETNISVRLQIPEATGRHVTYFRLRTKEGNIFGQRLWVDLRVVEPELDWVGVTEPLSLSSQSESISTPTPATISKPVITESILESTNKSDTISVAPETLAPPTVVQASPSASAPLMTPEPTNAIPSSNEVWTRVWSKELQVLADMGFNDSAVLIPLLQEHVGLPVSLCPELQGVPPAEGMQKLVAILLSRSGNFSF